MPQTYPERAARWPDMDREACEYLRSHDFVLLDKWSWTHPDPHKSLTAKETDAICYLIEEWDFGGFDMNEKQRCPIYTEEECAESFKENA